jgi:hypothetical protein
MKTLDSCRLLFLVALLVLSDVGSAGAISLTHTVGPQDNLYFDNWGHPWPDALGTGVPARSVQGNSGAFDFSGLMSVDVTATECIRDKGSICTNANGDGSWWRNLPTYALIGVWSDQPLSIDPVGDPFFIGTANTLVLPDAASLYLFLGENDGGFSDNTAGQYLVTLTLVPEPTALVLLGLGVVGLAVLRRR